MTELAELISRYWREENQRMKERETPTETYNPQRVTVKSKKETDVEETDDS